MRIFSIFFTLFCGLAAAVHSEELRVIAAGALPDSLNEISRSYERTSGNKVTIFYGAVPAMVKQVNSGEPFDLAIVPVDMAKSDLVRQRLSTKPGTDIGQVGFSVAVRSGDPIPNVKSVEALKQTLLDAKSVTFFVKSLGGEYILSVFDRLGIADAMKAKTRPQTAPGQGATRLIQGEAEIAIDVTNGLTITGVDIAGPLPAELQRNLVFTAVLASDAQAPGIAMEFIVFLKSKASYDVFKVKGIEPL
jgi:molybdate transport system substrate-binding protein